MLEKYSHSKSLLIIFDKVLEIDLKSDFETLKKYEYYEDGKILSESYYYKDLLHGPSSFFEDGKKISFTYFFLGKKQGKAFKYYKNEKIYSLEKFKDDMYHLDQLYFYENGSLKSKLVYSFNILKSADLFYENGSLKRSTIFENDKILKDDIFDMENKIIDEKFFKL